MVQGDALVFPSPSPTRQILRWGEGPRESLVLMHLFRLSFEEKVLQAFLFGALP